MQIRKLIVSSFKKDDQILINARIQKFLSGGGGGGGVQVHQAYKKKL